MTLANLVSYSAQIAIVVLVCAALPRALRLRSPGVQYAFWRALLAVCLVLPIVEPWQTHEMAFVPAPAAVAASAVAAPSTPPVPAAAWSAGAIASRIAPFLLLGIAARLAWLSAGVLRLQRLRRRATGRANDFGDLQQTIGTSATILWSDDVRQPVTFGVLRPVVLLPAGLAASDSAAERAVVAHELHHVKRRDWAWVVAEEVVRSVFWFHPAVWWLISRVQLARETVVDELSILTTNARRAYLDALLAFADDTGLAPTPAFSARRHLFHRVMLLSKEGNMSSSRIALASCALVAALGAGSWSAVRAFPLASTIVLPEVAPQPVTLRDTSIRQAVELWEKARKETSLSNDERLTLLRRGIELTDRALNIDPNSRDAMVWKDVLLRLSVTLTAQDEARAAMERQADELRDKVIAMQKQSSSLHQTRTTPGQLPPPPPPPKPTREMPPPPPPPPPPSADMPESFMKTIERLHPVRIGGSVLAPVKLQDVRPRYPEDALAAHIQGEIKLEAIVDPEGHVADARVVEGVAELNDAALSAVKQWEFKPTLLNGEPTSVIFQCTITFSLR